MAVGSGWAWDESFTANADLNDYQYHFVSTGSVAGEVQLCTTTTCPNALGILQNDPKVGEEAQVRIVGKSKLWVSVGTAVVYGDQLASGSIGHGEQRQTGTCAVSAVALEALASGSAVITVLCLMPGAVCSGNQTP